MMDMEKRIEKIGAIFFKFECNSSKNHQRIVIIIHVVIWLVVPDRVYLISS